MNGHISFAMSIRSVCMPSYQERLRSVVPRCARAQFCAQVSCQSVCSDVPQKYELELKYTI